MKKILWVGDAGCPSGFGRATHETLDALDYRLGGNYEVTVLGINYRGDPHDYPYKIYAAEPGGDSFGVGRLRWMCERVKPDLIVLQNDGWNLQPYLEFLRAKKPDGTHYFPEHAKIPVVAALAVDGKNFNGKWLDGIAHVVFWTEFAEREARLGGYTGPATVIPLGVDLSVYRPMDKAVARAKHLPASLKDVFLVGNVNRNQPRKRWDLTVKYFAAWVKGLASYATDEEICRAPLKIEDAYLCMQVAPTGDIGFDIKQLAAYYGIVHRLVRVELETFYGVSEEELAERYNCLDVLVSTTQGEGFGLTTIEAMACGVPCQVPDWAALGDWARGAARMVPCSTTAIGMPYVNVIGGVADQQAFVDGLNAFYHNRAEGRRVGRLGLARAREPRFRWANIGKAFAGVVDGFLGDLGAVPHTPTEEEWRDLGRREEATA